MRIYRLALYLLILAFAQNVSVADSEKPDLFFHHLKHDLKSLWIRTIFQDSYGFIWIGTASGLHRYDGYDFDYFLTERSPLGRNYSMINAIYEDNDTSLWVAMGDGLYRYRRKFDAFEKQCMETVEQVGAILTIAEDHESQMWLGSEKAGLLKRRNGDSVFHLYTSSFLPADLHVTFLKYSQKNLWIGTKGQGLYRLNLTTGEVASIAGLEGAWITSMDTHNTLPLWVTTMGQGLYQVDKSQMAVADHYTYDPSDSHSLANDFCQIVEIDDRQSVWVGNINGGLHLYDRKDNTFTRYYNKLENPNSLAENSIETLLADRQGRLWVGTGHQGISVLDPNYKKFDYYMYNPNNTSGLNNNSVRGFWEDNDQNIFIATDGGGLNYWNRKTNEFEHFIVDTGNKQTISSDAVLTFTEDREGALWLGTWEGGINILKDLKKGAFRHLDADGKEGFSLPNNNVFALLHASDDQIYIGHYGTGLSIYNQDTKRISNYQFDPKDSLSISSNVVYTLCEDRDGTVWVGTLEGGLNKIQVDADGNISFKRFVFNKDNPFGIPDNDINHVLSGSDGYLWVATPGGLARLNYGNEKFYNYTEKDGLPTNDIRALVEDDNATLWISTAAGISRFDRMTGKFKNYAVDDGLLDDHFFKFSAGKTSRGELLFGGVNGFVIFNPKLLKDNPNPPEIYLTKLSVFNKVSIQGEVGRPLSKSLLSTHEITLDPDQNVFSIEYTGLNYSRPEHNQYAYRLIGLHDEWNYVGNQRTASFTGLPSGTYQFEVIASNNDGIWNLKPASVTIHVLQYWYMSVWFRTLLLTTIFLIILLAVYLRFRFLKYQKKVLESKVLFKTRTIQDQKDELEKRNQELVSVIEHLRVMQQKLVESEKMNMIGRLAAGLAHELNNPLNYIGGAVHPISRNISDLESMITSVEGKEIIRETRGLLEFVSSGSKKASGIVNGFLGLSPQSDFSDYMTIDLGKVLLDLIETYRIKFPDAHFHCELKNKGTVYGNVNDIAQVFQNILENALEAIPSSRQAKLVCSLDVGEGYAFIKIRDNGEGVPPDSMVFDPFYTTKGESQSIGLGLFIVYTMIKKYSGDISYVSGSWGTEFIITLPVDGQKP
ncbi:MAG: ATP-binding protein [Cyclobacteriaceae bacterium]|nr:ATP-binding protein [Cyclobacteriaceae bacterium]